MRVSAELRSGLQVGMTENPVRSTTHIYMRSVKILNIIESKTPPLASCEINLR